MSKQIKISSNANNMYTIYIKIDWVKRYVSVWKLHKHTY